MPDPDPKRNRDQHNEGAEARAVVGRPKRRAGSQRGECAASACLVPKLGRRNGRIELHMPFQHGHVNNLADDLLIERPAPFDSHGESDGDKAPDLGKAAAVAGQVDQHEADPQLFRFRRLLHGLCLLGRGRSLVFESTSGRTFFATRMMAAHVQAGFFLFLLRGGHDKRGGYDAVLVGPGNFFPIGVTAAVVPALIGRGSRTGCPGRERAASGLWRRAKRRGCRRFQPEAPRSAEWKGVASRLVPRLA